MIAKNTFQSRWYIIFIPNILLIFLILHQYGLSYHLSFGSIGLLTILLISRKNISSNSVGVAFIAAALLVISFALNVFKYGDANNTLKIFRFALNAFALFVVLNKRCFIRPPSVGVVAFAVIGLSIFSAYQILIDLNFRVPRNWIALSGDSGGVFVVDDYLSYKVLRGSGPYTEPSVLGLMFSCLLAICLKIKTRFGLFLSALCGISIVLSGSLLGLVGLLAIVFISIYNREIDRRIMGRFFIIFSVALVALFVYGEGHFALFERSYSDSGLLDASTATRIYNPFILIYSNFANLDFFGFSGDIYKHFLHTGLYDSFESFPGHNGFLGVVMTFGLAGIMILWLLFRNLVGWEEVVVIVLIGSQSGNFFSYEKVFFMLYVVMTLRGIKVLDDKNSNRKR